MNSASFRFYGSLNDLLPPDRRGRTLLRRFFAPTPVKDLIESFGVPHTEVELVTLNGEPVDMARRVEAGDRIAVYPHFESLEILTEHAVAGLVNGDGPLRFILDVHLGRLAAYLRMLGFDALWNNAATDPELARAAAAEERILVTRDRHLLMRNEVRRGCCIRSTDPHAQLAQVVRRYRLVDAAQPFTRCLVCNGELHAAGDEAIRDKVPPHAAEHHSEFRECGGCGRVFWKGSHYERMMALIRDHVRP